MNRDKVIFRVRKLEKGEYDVVDKLTSNNVLYFFMDPQPLSYNGISL